MVGPRYSAWCQHGCVKRPRATCPEHGIPRPRVRIALRGRVPGELQRDFDALNWQLQCKLYDVPGGATPCHRHWSEITQAALDGAFV